LAPFVEACPFTPLWFAPLEPFVAGAGGDALPFGKAYCDLLTDWIEGGTSRAGFWSNCEGRTVSETVETA
jgi:hypothetical protein